MADVWANSKACHPRVTCHTVERCHLANSMSWFQSYMSHCRVLPPGEFNGMSSQSHVSHCSVLPLGHDSRATCHIAGCSHLAKSMSWSCHITGCKNSIRHIENRFSPYFFLFSKCSVGFDERRLSYRLRYAGCRESDVTPCLMASRQWASNFRNPERDVFCAVFPREHVDSLYWNPYIGTCQWLQNECDQYGAQSVKNLGDWSTVCIGAITNRIGATNRHIMSSYSPARLTL